MCHAIDGLDSVGGGIHVTGRHVDRKASRRSLYRSISQIITRRVRRVYFTFTAIHLGDGGARRPSTDTWSMRYASFLPSWAANGAFLVNRRLRQDVAGFWRWCFMLCTLYVMLCSDAGARRCTDTETDTGADADALYTLYFVPVHWCWCRCWIERGLRVPVRKGRLSP